MRKQDNGLTASRLYAVVREGFGQVADWRTEGAGIALQDIRMAGFALFSLKDPSLLAFDARRKEANNVQSVYGIQQIPCDTYLRTVLDEVNPEALRPVYQAVFRQAVQGKVLDPYLFLGQSYLVSPDGTGYFASRKLNCAHCWEKTLRNGETHSYHYSFGAAIVHPHQKTVLPLMPEPIMRQDGEQKNDCERNAAKRFLAKVGSQIRLWDKLRAYFLTLTFDSMETLYKAIAYGFRMEKIVILADSS